MDYAEIKQRIAPCGLNCGKCCAYEGGEIQEKAKGLAAALGVNFKTYAKLFEKMNPVFEQYIAFEALLSFFAEGSCSGCRGKGCLFHACKVAGCVKDHNVDFCFQCAEFPCEDHGFHERLAKLWKANNERMDDCGVKEYYNKIKDKPRYP